MNREAPSPKRQTAREAEPARARLFRAWHQFLNDCAAEPTKKRVHGLRVTTMRLQASIDACLANQTRDRARNQEAQSPALAAAKRWKKQAKRLRRKLSVVRSFDVYLIKTTVLRDFFPARRSFAQGSVRGSKQAALRHLAAFQSRLKKDRRTAAKKLAQALHHRLDRLTRLGFELEALLPSDPAQSSENIHRRMLADLKSVLAAQPKLSAGSLHGFRKQIKGLRYRAESESEGDARIAHFAKAIKVMQDAIGEWHDWMTLAEEASGQPGKRSELAVLAALLETRAAESLKQALQVCRSSIAELGLRASLPAARRKPVRPVEPSSPTRDKRRAA